ncbi:MAG: hypothetical protein ACXVFV_04000 [Mycobacteriales bacterium]
MTSTRLAALFLTSLVGVLVVVGLALTPLGWVAEVPYLLAVAVLLSLLVRRARALRRPPAGATCSCCTSTVYDQVEVR